MEFITAELTPWHWMTGGLLLCAIELLLPTTFFLWPGIAAIATGLVTALLPAMDWQLQVSVFAALAMVITVCGRVFYKRNTDNQAVSTLNRRADTVIGQQVTVDEAIINGVGSTNIGKTRWRIVGADAASGTLMVVTGLDGSSLVVEPVDSGRTKAD